MKKIAIIFFCLFTGVLMSKEVRAQYTANWYLKAAAYSTYQSFLEVESQGTNSAFINLHNQNSSYGNFLMEGPILRSPYYGLDFRYGSTPLLTLLSSGSVGIGTNNPTAGKLLHIKGSSPSLFIDGVSSSPMIELGINGSSAHEIQFSGGDGQLKVGPTGTTAKAIHFRQATGIIFSNNRSFATSTNVGLSGTYIFDSQVSSTSLLVAPAGASGSYPAIPSGNIFNVQGNSSLMGSIQVNNTTTVGGDLTPSKAVAGITIGNKLTTTSPLIPYSWIQSQESRPLVLNPDSPESSTNNYVAIGFTPGQYAVPAKYKLAVKGKIICEELKVKYAGSWSDYVFEKDYKLRELKEVEQYIGENKHLPDVPSAAEVKENGFESGEMNATLLRKIEELTLYMIDINKQVELLKKENEELKKVIKQ